MSEPLKQEVNMKQWDFQMLVIFSGIYSCASHRCVPSVSFVCLLNFHKTPCLLHKNILHFTDICTSISGNPLLITCLCTPGVDAWSWRTDGTGLGLLPTAELTELCRSCVWNDTFCNWQSLQWLDTLQEFLGMENLGWDIDLDVVMFILNIVMFIWLQELPEGKAGGSYCATSLLGVTVLSLVNKQGTYSSYPLSFKK